MMKRNQLLFKWCIISTAFMITMLLLLTTNKRLSVRYGYNAFESITGGVLRTDWRNFSQAQKESLTEMGRYLYMNETPIVQEPDKHYKILIWKYGGEILSRHIYFYGNKEHDPFEECSVKNCEITYKDEDAKTADAVVFQIQRMKGVREIPDEKYRTPNQVWIFLTDETPFHTFLHGGVKLADFNGKFNWSMTYRMDSDVPVPYGRTVLKTPDAAHDIVTFSKRTDVLVAIMGSNCGSQNHRWQYVAELKKHIQIDMYGHCGTLKCPGHYNQDCDTLKQYKFYLAFENSNCAQYITEKLWWNAYAKNAIPIVMGASHKEYEQLLPPNSYINTADFATPADLARYIIYVNNTNEIYKSYFDWKQYYEVKNEHGYFQTRSYHYCRVCEALNYNKRQEKIYKNLEDFWSRKDCYSSWDAT